jgi:hypothetical protein
MKIVYTKGNLPFDLWLGSGLPIDPYVKGLIHSYLREKMVPRQLTEPPTELQLGGGARDMLEWTMLRRWMSQWLRYLKWYAEQWAASFEGASIESWFMGPVVTTCWYSKGEDPENLRFGLIWKIFDLINFRQVSVPLALTASGQGSIDEVKLVNPWTHSRGEYPTMEGSDVIYLGSFRCEGPDVIHLGPLSHRTEHCNQKLKRVALILPNRKRKNFSKGNVLMKDKA